MQLCGTGRSERGLFGCDAGSAPRVGLLTRVAAPDRLGGSRPRVRLAGTLGCALAGRLAAGETATAAGAGGAGDLGGGVLQARADFLDLDLEDRPLLTLAGLIGAGLQATLHHDTHAALEGLGNVLRGLTPDRAGEEQRVAVLPLVGVLVEG